MSPKSKVTLSDALLAPFVLFLTFVAPLGAQSSADKPTSVVRRLYADVSCEAVMEEPRCPADRDLSKMSRDQLGRYFDRRLVDLWLRDRQCVARTRGICNLDFLPVWDSQDPAGLTVRVVPGDREDRVVAELRRPAGVEVVRLQFDLVRRSKGWRIRDVSKPAVWSLAELLSRR